MAAWRTATRGTAVSAEDLVRLLVAELEPHGVKTFQWHLRRDWTDAAEVVIAACRSVGWDPRTYMRAQAAMMGWFCARDRIPFTTRMVVGEKAAARFRKWATNNEQRHGTADRDRAAEAAYESLLAAECTFATRYLTTDAKAQDVDMEVRGLYPDWALSTTRAMPHVRLPGLVAGLLAVDPALPYRLLVPADGASWSWPVLRRSVRALYEEPAPLAPASPIDLDPELGLTL